MVNSTFFVRNCNVFFLLKMQKYCTSSFNSYSDMKFNLFTIFTFQMFDYAIFNKANQLRLSIASLFKFIYFSPYTSWL